ncbi:MAG TPA: GNAT family N-acetyltransferase [Victivallales bacterium]|nr:GNAT family N-acetyltransferase [Victivallales bacterium]
MNNITIREVKKSDLDRCYEIEITSYEGDEAADRSKIIKRINTYPKGFIVLEVDDAIAGFINCGATDKIELSDEDFKELIGHDPNGKHIVIMSVVVHPDYQGKGYAGMLMNHFINKMIKLDKTSIYLICQTRLIKMYEKYGFEYIVVSNSDHGGLSWHEMVLKLK